MTAFALRNATSPRSYFVLDRSRRRFRGQYSSLGAAVRRRLVVAVSRTRRSGAAGWRRRSGRADGGAPLTGHRVEGAVGSAWRRALRIRERASPYGCTQNIPFGSVIQSPNEVVARPESILLLEPVFGVRLGGLEVGHQRSLQSFAPMSHDHASIALTFRHTQKTPLRERARVDSATGDKMPGPGGGVEAPGALER